MLTRRSLACIFAGIGWAAVIYDTSACTEVIGFRTEGADITVGGNYATGSHTLRIDWRISDLGGGNWHSWVWCQGIRLFLRPRKKQEQNGSR